MTTPVPEQAATTHVLSTAVPDVLAAASIVVIDDMSDNVALLEQVLLGAGVGQVRGFTDPREALTSCAETPPDLVLVDLHMPHLDGVGVMKALAEGSPEGAFLPVVVLTADITADARQRVLEAGAKDFLTKPFDINEVVLRVRNLLETSTLYRRLERQNADLRDELEVQAAAERAAQAVHEERAQRIDAALVGPSFRMVFQPIIDLVSGSVVGAEALARFQGEPHQPPNIWFAEAAEVGRGVELELAAIATAVEQLDALPAGVFLSVNASPTAAISTALHELLRAAPADRIVIELTEHERIDDYDHLVDALTGLRALGVRVAVDDTGAGYASLEHLLSLQAEILKLDLALTRGIDRDPVRRSLAAALVAFGRDTGSTIVAEGVETAEELAVLASLGVPWAQGYHLARPDQLPLPPPGPEPAGG
jgi:EAL domain-containing protein (putative c-di-GMP-specific phosphodiesterase class I)